MSVQPRVVYSYPTFSRLLCALAVLCFVLAAFGVHFPLVDIVDIGLALGFGSLIIH